MQQLKYKNKYIAFLFIFLNKFFNQLVIYFFSEVIELDQCLYRGR